MDFVDMELLLGPIYFRRAYRMSYKQFTTLCDLLEPHMKSTGRTACCPNTHIPCSTCISAAIRYCAGGSQYDIFLSHGMSHSSIFVCLWDFISAIHKCTVLDIAFPKSQVEQEVIASNFKKASKAEFDRRTCICHRQMRQVN